MFKRLASLLGMIFGSLGLVVCCFGIYAVGVAGARLSRANDRAFAMVDRSLAGARDRVLRIQERVQQFGPPIDELGKVLRSWTSQQATEQIASRLDIESKAHRLAESLQQADLWLETATESLEAARQLLETAKMVGAPVEGEMLDEALGQLATVRSSLHQAQTVVEGVRDFAAKADDPASADERTARAVRLVARLVVAISEIDTRLGKLAPRLSELQTSAGQLQARMSHYIAGTTGVVVLLGVWMAAGQVTWFRYGWKTYYRKGEEVTGSGSSPLRPSAE